MDEPQPAPKERLQLVDLSAPPARRAAARQQPKPAEVLRPEPVVSLPVEPPIAAASIAPDPALADAAGVGGGCDIAALLQQSFTTDPASRDAVGRIAPAARSVANAVMLWDGDWVAPEALGGADTLEPIKSRMIERIRSAPAECLPTELTGPRFILISDAAGTTTLVLGSGRWRWAQLLEEGGKLLPEATP